MNLNWDAIGAIAEGIAAIAVVATLGYLAVQIRHAKSEAADANRLMRATGVREMTLLLAQSDDLRRSVIKTLGLEQHFEDFGREFGVEVLDAERLDYVAQYYFWLHWGQFSATTTAKDLEELRHIIGEFYTLPAMKHAWTHSPFGKNFFEEDFVKFVDAIIEEEA